MKTYLITYNNGNQEHISENSGHYLFHSMSGITYGVSLDLVATCRLFQLNVPDTLEGLLT